ncbi:glucosamine--fructose-6-phosphate aminotransferase (isomerizing) [Ferrithrix thermotolerans DSM 19514]|uniref:Glutamine--fructose-6-phosphate aminotransferase [isomerizing] n=1 Tax=Ferrithrix thermotolerans DSM 19514 TaxID=1121881 RepID=A0A1M4SUM1_9ACTN|nr:glutamine--fructose-6-phosphate transaminase (isomerizing) [Ferrithrix thermotolerans]SHE35914.1 glucosamine--fructose-6-phosphate aminotransferase (isomerizing) [Ferrithrix thermotolerans DSM 19514]
MCGIVGIVGSGATAAAVVEGLRRLEYRGYDSAGMVLASSSGFEVRRVARDTSSIAALSEWLEGQNPPRQLVAAIGHTRWATHGRPSEMNAHPHLDCSGHFAVVHNGIVENYKELKDELIALGHEFASETDTEVIVHLVEERFRLNGDAEASVQEAFSRLMGSMAVVVLDLREPNTLYMMRRMAPLVVGVDDSTLFVASDVPALLDSASSYFMVPEDTLTVGKVRSNIVTLSPELDELRVEWDVSRVEVGGFSDFMSKEIDEQPRSLRDTLAGRVDQEGRISLDELNITQEELKTIQKVVIVGCGTSLHAGMVARYALEHFVRVPVEIDVSSEFRYRDPVLSPTTLVVGVSQSGETLDTMVALSEAKASGAKTLVVSNVVGSSMARMADAVLYTRAGPEISVASTKTFIAQIGALEILALYLADLKRTLYPSEVNELIGRLNAVPEAISVALSQIKEYERVAQRLLGYDRFYFIGRNVGYPVALEGALKLKEITYTPSEGYPAGELKHGPIAMIDEQAVVVAIAPKGALYEKVLANVEEVRARGAKVVLVVNEMPAGHMASDDDVFLVPQVHQLFSPMVDVVPLQVLAHYTSVARGLDPDRPRNLAKTVTVE